MEQQLEGEKEANMNTESTKMEEIGEILKKVFSNGDTVKMVVDTVLRVLLTYLLTELLTPKK